LEALGLPYEVQRYRRDPQTLLAPPELLVGHALGKSLVITGAVSLTGLHFAEGSAMPPVLLKLIFDRLVQAPMPFFGLSLALPGSFRYARFLACKGRDARRSNAKLPISS
jgi:glutathione S-transferase